MKFSILILLILFNYADTSPDGAPAGACSSMTPGHFNVFSQACSSNYIIQADKTEYYSNDTVRITVSGATSSDTFRGLLLIAKTETSEQIIGSWTVVNSTIQTLACNNIANTGVTHNSRVDKTSAQAVWTPPQTASAEKTIIRATIVKVYNTTYVNCFNLTLTNRQDNTSSSTTAATTVSPSRIISSTDSISWTYANGTTTVKMQASSITSGQWFALGLSLDQSMGEDHVFVCKRLANDTVILDRLINAGGYVPPVSPTSVLSDPGGTFTPLLQKLENGVSYCEFTLSNFGASGRRRRAISGLSQSTPYYPLIAIGNLDSSGAITSRHISRSALSQTVQLDRSEIVLSGDSSSSSAAVTTTVPTTTASTSISSTDNISWTYANGITSVKMQIRSMQTAQWFALGLSLDQSMGEDHVFVCKRLANDTVVLDRLINAGGYVPPVSPTSVLSDPGGTFTPLLQRLENGVSYCEFTLSNFGASGRRRRAISGLSQSTPYYPLIATGNLDTSGAITSRHTSRSVLPQTVQLDRNETVLSGNGSSGSIEASTTVPPSSSSSGEVEWTYANGITSVKMQTSSIRSGQWLALGLSLDQRMGEDHVFVCKRLANDEVVVDRLVNPGGYTVPVSPSTDSGGTFTRTSQRLENGVSYCEFTLSNFGTSGRRRRAISGLLQSADYYPLFAIGNLDSSGAITTRHTEQSALSQIVRLNRNEKITYGSSSSRIELMKAHGIIMIFVWMLFVPTGILLARYFKPSFPEHKLCGKAIWFSIHRVVMTSVAVLTIVAFVLILVYEKGKWVSRSNKREFAHSIVGIITICFAIIQPIMALFRCHPDGQYRFIFNYAHRFVGFSALILSTVALFLAMFFARFNFKEDKQWGILVAWVCWLPVIFILLWLVDFYYRRFKKNSKNSESYDLGNSVDPENEHIKENQTQQDRIKLILLIIHILIVLGLSIALASVIGINI